jgi:hypothetical protein
VRKYTIIIEPSWTRIYLECNSQPTFWPADDDAGTPARLEVDGISLEFEGEVTLSGVQNNSGARY